MNNTVEGRAKERKEKERERRGEIRLVVNSVIEESSREMSAHVYSDL